MPCMTPAHLQHRDVTVVLPEMFLTSTLSFSGTGHAWSYLLQDSIDDTFWLWANVSLSACFRSCQHGTSGLEDM